MGKVEPYNCWDGVVNGGPGVEEFENILNILDFPMESLEGDGFIGDWDASKSQYFGPIPSDVLIGPPTIATGPPLVLLPASSAPIDTKPELKQHLSYQSEGTSSSFVLRPNKCTNIKEQGLFNTQSPVSVLESNGSSSAHKIPLINSCISKRTRTARARPSGLSSWLSISPLSDARQSCNARKSRERRKKLCQLSVAKKTTTEDSSDSTDSPNSDSRRPGVAKKCTHCEVTKTPQWREGPMGPRTLCNACGVRYRSGRLFPEYRPALSPSFSPALHSNSHKKVLEMRGTARQREVTKIEEPSSVSPRVEFVPLSSNLFDYMC